MRVPKGRAAKPSPVRGSSAQTAKQDVLSRVTASDVVFTDELKARMADVLERVRLRSPRVHCITNAVAQNFSANMLLALGAVPSMTIAPEEVGAFAAGADALLINLGTFDAERRAACETAVASVGAADRPWVLDPVFIERSKSRAAFAKALVDRNPQTVRLNDAEFGTLAGVSGNERILRAYAREKRTVLALTGETDLVTDGDRLARIANGHPLMAKVTAMGCAGSAVIAACLAVEPDPWQATIAGLV